MTFAPRAALVAATLALSACMPYPVWRFVAVPTDQHNVAADSDDALEVGDKVRARNKRSGKTYRFTVHRLDKDGFVGVQSTGHKYKVLYDDLSLLEVERISWRLTGYHGSVLPGL